MTMRSTPTRDQRILRLNAETRPHWLLLRHPEATQQRLDKLEELYEAFNLLSKPGE